METSAGVHGGVTASRWFRTAAAIFFVFLWGSAFVPSKIGVLASSPLWFLVFRFAASGALALVIARGLGAPWPRGRRAWTLIVLLGVYPGPVLSRIEPSVNRIIAHVEAVTHTHQPLVARYGPAGAQAEAKGK